ncbi:MAG TPA: DNA repair protein RadA, partial [Gammaproteobacteria bacterium]|nr:DNA repair protein RadA [Gammaproteobacteria bacterium]
MKSKREYQCQNCGSTQPKWSGQCGECESWNTLEETRVSTVPSASPRFEPYAGQRTEVTPLADVTPEEA